MKYLYAVFSWLFLSYVWVSCVEDPQLTGKIRNAVKPEVVTGKIMEQTAEKVVLSGEVKKDGGAPLKEFGICWSRQSPVKDHIEHKQPVTDGKWQFQVQIEGLKPQTEYFMCAYAENGEGISYGEEVMSNTTTGLGIVRTLEPTGIKAESAVCGGVIDKNNPGEGEIKARGVFLKTDTALKPDTISFPVQADSFVYRIEKLTPLTTYSVQAFVTNSYGTFKGAEKKFSTTDGKALIESFQKGTVGYTEALFQAIIADEGDAPVTERGFCYGPEKDPTIEENDTIVCGKGDGAFSGVIKGLASQKPYYVRAFAINSYGVSYSQECLNVVTKNESPTLRTAPVENVQNGSIQVGGEVIDEGMTAVTVSGICWSTSPKPTLEKGNVLPLSSGQQVFTGTITGLKGGVTYYIRAYATNESGTVYDETGEVVFEAPSIFETKAFFSGTARLAGSAACFAVGNKGYLLGGDTGPSLTDEFNKYSVSENKWDEMRQYPKKLKWMTAVPYNNNVVVFGGLDENENPTDGLYYCDLSGSIGNKWEELTRSSNGLWPDALYYATGCKAGDAFLLIGGRRDTVTNEVWSYIPIRSQWVKNAPFPEKQYGGISVVINNIVYAGLGMNTIGISPTSSKNLWISSTHGDSWTKETTMPQGAGNVRFGVALKEHIFVIDEKGVIWKYDTTAHTWTKKSQIPSVGQEVYCMFAIEESIYIGSGSSGLFRYDPSWDN